MRRMLARSRCATSLSAEPAGPYRHTCRTPGFAEAAAMPFGGLAALYFLQGKAQEPGAGQNPGK